MSAEQRPTYVPVVENRELAWLPMIVRLENHPVFRVVGAVSGLLSGRKLVNSASGEPADIVTLDFAVGPLGVDGFEAIKSTGDPESSMCLLTCVEHA